MQSKKYHFESILQKGGMSYLFIVPVEIVNAANQKGRFRINGIVNGINFNLAIQKTKEGIHYLMIGKALKKEAKLTENETYKISFTIANPNQLNIPETVEVVFQQDIDFAKFWNELSIGKKRSFLVYITSSKSVDVQIKRIYEIFEKYSKGELYSQRIKNNKP